MRPIVLKTGALDMQVCVPKVFTDEEIVGFANRENFCGTSGGWHIRREGDEAPRGDPERVQCSEFESMCHVMLDA